MKTNNKENTENTIRAYTDGSCIGNPGPSGIGFLIRYPDGTILQKGEPLGDGTNNIAELTAIYRVAQIVEDKSTQLLIHTDSTYSIGVLTKNWKAKANKQLIAKIRQEIAKFSHIGLIKVKAHSDVSDNKTVDNLAYTSASTQIASTNE